MSEARKTWPPVPKVAETVSHDESNFTPYVQIPLKQLDSLFKTRNVFPVVVHGVTISVNLEEFQKISDKNPESLATLNALSASLEAEMTVDEVVQIRDRQVFSYKTGADFMLDPRTNVSSSSLKVVLPALVRNFVIEEVPVEGYDYDVATTLIEVKPEHTHVTGGLDKILKKSSVVEILNLIVQEAPEKELAFYFELLLKMKESNTTALVLQQMRLNMQYALNTDTVMLQSAMTSLILKGDENNECISG